MADTPKEPFVPLVDCAVTPKERNCIDGTLYIQGGVPYIIYSHDWPDNYIAEEKAYVGEICAAQLSDDFTTMVGEPWVLFASNESPISKSTPHHIVYNNQNCVRYGSDAPFVQKLSDGSLILTWFPYLNDKYVVLSVISKSENIKGSWTHISVPLYDKNGGHAMFFIRAKGSIVCVCTHQNSRCVNMHISLRLERWTETFVLLKRLASKWFVIAKNPHNDCYEDFCWCIKAWKEPPVLLEEGKKLK